MRHFSWLYSLAAIFLSISLLAPASCAYAANQKQGSKTHKGAVKKKPAATVKTAARQSSAAQNGQQADDSDRELWLKRVRESEVFTGKASWYGSDFHNKATASGVKYDMHTFTAAHRTLPLGTVVRVTDQQNGKSVMVCVTDRGPYVRGRIIDVSYAAAQRLDLSRRGVSKVALEVVSDETGAPLKADQAYFVRYLSENGKNTVGPFKGFADAMAMHEAISQAHPEAEVVLEKAPGKISDLH